MVISLSFEFFYALNGQKSEKHGVIVTLSAFVVNPLTPRVKPWVIKDFLTF